MAMNQGTSDDDIEFARKLRSVLDADLDRIDGTTRLRLRQIRAAALRTTRPPPRQIRWAPAAAGATALLAAVILLRGPGPAGAPVPETVLDIELITANESLDMIEDLDFFLWLDGNDLEG
jgi:hypothetical protein